MSLGVRRDSPFKPALDARLDRMREGGHVDRLIRKGLEHVRVDESDSSREAERRADQSRLDLDEMWGLLNLYVALIPCLLVVGHFENLSTNHLFLSSLVHVFCCGSTSNCMH